MSKSKLIQKTDELHKIFTSFSSFFWLIISVCVHLPTIV